jgi:mannose-1-phosphate guanylyltransferase
MQEAIMHLYKAGTDLGNNKHLWGIVLAGGNGKRLENYICSRFGTSVPKQYCAFHGTRSMLSHTLSRVELLVPRDHIFVTIQYEHLNYAAESLKDIPPQNIAVQPMNRETGVGIIHALLHIFHKDPRAMVAIFPSDHFILEEKRFMEYVADGVAFIKKNKNKFLVLGIEPDQLESDYGWIEPGVRHSTVRGTSINQVTNFYEKPSTPKVMKMYENKYWLWNTMVMVSSVDAMIGRFCRLMPDIVVPILTLQEHFYSPKEYEKTKAVYDKLPSVNFSFSILEKAVEDLAVLRVKNVYWSDWGSPQRIEKDIAFLEECVNEEYFFAW